VYFEHRLKGFPLELDTGAWGQKHDWETDGGTGPRKKFDEIFSRLDTIHERDGQTDTGQQQRPRLRIASRGKHRASVPSLLQYWLLYTDDHDQHPHTGLTGSRPGNYRDRPVKRNRLSGITHTRRYKTLPLKQTVNELLYTRRHHAAVTDYRVNRYENNACCLQSSA